MDNKVKEIAEKYKFKFYSSCGYKRIIEETENALKKKMLFIRIDEWKSCMNFLRNKIMRVDFIRKVIELDEKIRANEQFVFDGLNFSLTRKDDFLVRKKFYYLNGDAMDIEYRNLIDREIKLIVSYNLGKNIENAYNKIMNVKFHFKVNHSNFAVSKRDFEKVLSSENDWVISLCNRIMETENDNKYELKKKENMRKYIYEKYVKNKEVIEKINCLLEA